MFGFLAFLVWAYMTVWFGVAALRKRNDLADVAWGIGFVVLAWASWIVGTGSILAAMVNTLVTVWGTRLAWHIYRRHRGRPEDFRYAAWRVQWGAWVLPRSYAQIFLLQGALMYGVALPVLAVNLFPLTTSPFVTVVGFAVWCIGFAFESIGDAQLARFIADPAQKGKLLMSGLWKYTRHPNYFGEVTQWWGIWCVVVASTGAWWTVIGPLIITGLILWVSGIPMLEAKMKLHPDFAAYAKRTNRFFPMIPRRS